MEALLFVVMLAVLRSYFEGLAVGAKGGQPKPLASDADVLKGGPVTKGAIGYVSTSADAVAAKKVQAG